MKTNCIYFVEGKCEAALLAALKERPQKIMSGRVKIFNVIGNLIPARSSLPYRPAPRLYLCLIQMYPLQIP